MARFGARAGALVLTIASASCGRIHFDRGDSSSSDGGPLPDVFVGDAAPGDGDVPPDVVMIPTVTVAIERSGSGAGDVRSALGDIDCGETCVVEVDRGSAIELTPTAAAGSWFAGWYSGPCTGFGTCRFVADADAVVDARFTPRPNRIFITSATYDGGLGGLDGADGQCARLAADAELPGTWIALLSTLTQSAFDRLTGSRGWIRVDGAPVADQSLMPRQWYAIRLDEHGVDVGRVPMWAPHANSVARSFCRGWTTNVSTEEATTMNSDRGFQLQAGGAGSTCDQQRRFLCAEVGITTPITLPPIPGRSVFISTAAWTPITGVAEADDLCATEASAAGLDGTFRALLAQPGVSPIGRFSDGLPWVRSDGMPLLPSVEDWLASDFFDAAPALGSAGATLGFVTVHVGAGGLAVPGTMASTCDGWTSDFGLVPGCISSWETAVACGFSTGCDAPRAVVCMQD